MQNLSIMWLNKVFWLLLAFFHQPVNKVHGQSVTSGNIFEQILGDDEDDHNSIDQIMVFNMCGVEEWCTHVVKWKDSGEFELINYHEHKQEINDDEIAGIWVKGSKSGRFKQTKTIKENGQLLIKKISAELVTIGGLSDVFYSK